MIFYGVMIFFSSVFTFFNGLAREVEVESVFSVSTASSDWIGLVLTFFNGLAREVEVESVFSVLTSLYEWICLVLTFFNGLAREVEVESEPALVSSLQQMIFDGVITWALSVAPKETEL